jgi:hypothetical protein
MSEKPAESSPTYQLWSKEEVAEYAQVQLKDLREAAKDASKELREINGASESVTEL